MIVLNGVSFLAVIGALQLMRPWELTQVERAPRTKGMIRDGVRYVRDRPVLKMVLVAGFFAGTFGMNFQMTSALMATQVFHKGASEYGLLGTTLALGSLTGALLGCAAHEQAAAPAGDRWPAWRSARSRSSSA